MFTKPLGAREVAARIFILAGLMLCASVLGHGPAAPAGASIVATR